MVIHTHKAGEKHYSCCKRLACLISAGFVSFTGALGQQASPCAGLPLNMETYIYNNTYGEHPNPLPSGVLQGMVGWWRISRSCNVLGLCEGEYSATASVDCDPDGNSVLNVENADTGRHSAVGWRETKVSHWCPPSCECPQDSTTYASGHAVVHVYGYINANNGNFATSGHAGMSAMAAVTFGGILAESGGQTVEHRVSLSLSASLSEGTTQVSGSLDAYPPSPGIAFNGSASGDRWSQDVTHSVVCDTAVDGCAINKRIRLTGEVHVRAYLKNQAYKAHADADTEIWMFSISAVPPENPCEHP